MNAIEQWLLKLCRDREEHRAVLSLPDHAREIIAGHEPANPYYRWDDWRTDDRGYTPPSPN